MRTPPICGKRRTVRKRQLTKLLRKESRAWRAKLKAVVSAIQALDEHGKVTVLTGKYLAVLAQLEARDARGGAASLRRGGGAR